MALPSFLGDEQVTIPTGGDFTPSGLIGQISAGVAYRVGWVETDLAQNPEFKPTLIVPSATGKFRYYFATKDEADAAAEACGSTFGSETVWVLETPTSTVLNLQDPEARAKFGEQIRYDIEIKTPSSVKSRHLYHLIALPLAVQAMALAMGYIQEPVFNVNELVRPDEEQYTDEFQKDYIGDPDNKKVEGMLDSVLGKRRAELWAALGEKDAKAYRTMGSGKFATTSEKLSNCLAIVERVWKAPVWGEILSVHDPRIGAVNNSNGNRLRVAAIVRLFANKEAAQVAADEQNAARAARDGGAPATASGGTLKPALPKDWKDIGEAEFLSELKNYAKKPAVLAAKDLGITPDEFNAWLPFAS